MVKTTLAVLGATLGFGPAHGAFTLRQATRVDRSYEQALGVKAHVIRCRWRDEHDAICEVHAHISVINGVPAADYRWQDDVTRSGPCSTHLSKRLSPTSGIAHGSGSHNCFTGPLVAVPIRNSIEQSS